MATATASSNAAKLAVSFWLLTLRVSGAPATAPSIEATVNAPITPKSTFREVCALATNATTAVMAMISSEVEAARLMGKCSTKVSAGTIAKPPPTPKNPVSAPVMVATKATRHSGTAPIEVTSPIAETALRAGVEPVPPASSAAMAPSSLKTPLLPALAAPLNRPGYARRNITSPTQISNRAKAYINKSALTAWLASEPSQVPTVAKAANTKAIW